MEDIPYLLPSEIARLVYGQLKDLNCDEVAEKFLQTSPHMKECRELKQRNRSFTTKAYNLSLEEIFDQFLRMNELLLNAVNNGGRAGEKLHDPILALKFLSELNESTILERESPDGSKCLPDTDDNDNASDICLHVGSPPPEKMCNYPKKLDLLYNDELSNLASNSETDNLTKPRGKVKVLRPKLKTLPVAGKSINRCNSTFDSDDKDETPSAECENHQIQDDNQKDQLSFPFLTNNTDSHCQPQPQISTLASSSLQDRILQCDSVDVVFSLQPCLNDENHETRVGTVSENVRSSTPKQTNSSDVSFEETVTKNTRSRKTKKITSNDEIVWNENESVENIEVIKEKYIQKNIIENPKFAEMLANNINKTLHETPSEQIDRACAELAAKMAEETVQTDLHGLIDELLSSSNPSENKLEEHPSSENQQIPADQTVTKPIDNIQLMETSQQDLSQMNIRAYVMNNTDVMESTEDDIILCNSTPNNMILYSVDARDTYLNNAIVFGSNLDTTSTIVTDKAKKCIATKYQPIIRTPRVLPRLAPKPSTTPVISNAASNAVSEKPKRAVRSSKRIKKS